MKKNETLVIKTNNDNHIATIEGDTMVVTKKDIAQNPIWLEAREGELECFFSADSGVDDVMERSVNKMVKTMNALLADNPYAINNNDLIVSILEQSEIASLFYHLYYETDCSQFLDAAYGKIRHKSRVCFTDSPKLRDDLWMEFIYHLTRIVFKKVPAKLKSKLK